MPPKVERLDASNILEIKEIRKVLTAYEEAKKKDGLDLLSIFKLLIINTNRRLNDERLDEEIEAMDLEEDEEVELSDHSSDEEGE
jgi:hypothetical protein